MARLISTRAVVALAVNAAGMLATMATALAAITIFLALTGILALAIARHRAVAPLLFRFTAVALAGCYGILLGISLRYFFLAPTVCIGLAFLAFAVSLAPGGEDA